MATYKIEINREECIGDGMCCSDAPNTFEMDDEDIATVMNPEGDDAETILTAAQNCPVDAIKLIDIQTNQQVYPEA